MAEYQSYFELKKNEVEGKDYCIHFREGNSGILVMAPHAGDIEPATGELADSVAGDEHSFYAFWGMKAKNNARLHISSTCFDEPLAVDLAQRSNLVLTIHGSRAKRKVVYLGGRDQKAKDIVKKSLQQIEIPVGELSRLPGLKPENICNRNRFGKGVQLEISAGLREEFYEGDSDAALNMGHRNFVGLVKAIRGALRNCLKV
jgi:phage replication-related protein YjqB (UPF0714/DUF867 family)